LFAPLFCQAHLFYSLRPLCQISKSKLPFGYFATLLTFSVCQLHFAKIPSPHCHLLIPKSPTPHLLFWLFCQNCQVYFTMWTAWMNFKLPINFLIVRAVQRPLNCFPSRWSFCHKKSDYPWFLFFSTCCQRLSIPLIPPPFPFNFSFFFLFWLDRFCEERALTNLNYPLNFHPKISRIFMDGLPWFHLDVFKSPISIQMDTKKAWNLNSKLVNLLSICLKISLEGSVNFERASTWATWSKEWGR